MVKKSRPESDSGTAVGDVEPERREPEAAPMGDPSAPERPDRASMWRVFPDGAVTMLGAHYVHHSFLPHDHDHYVVSLIEKGAQRFRLGRERYETLPLHLILINPGEIHTGEAACPEGFVYRAIYPTTDFFASLAEEAGAKGGAPPSFTKSLVRDPELHGRLLRAHALAALPSRSLEAEALLYEAFALLIARYAEPKPAASPLRGSRREILRAVDYIRERFAGHIGLGEIAAVAGMSPYHFARTFREETGMPPHLFLENLRVRAAALRIRKGAPLADAAYSSGFSSQSHLCSVFKRVLGASPSVYRETARF